MLLFLSSFNKSPTYRSFIFSIRLKQIESLQVIFQFTLETNFKIQIEILSGPIITDIMENIQNLISNKSHGWKTKIYSGVIKSVFDRVYGVLISNWILEK